jgi:large subunit ribosomal protein L9
MQVILLEKVANLGQLGDVVKVKEGFARNYLIPQGKARRASEAALKEFENRRVDLEKAHSDRLQVAQALGTRLGGLTVQIPARAGVDGRLFGSVTNYDIAEAVNKQGFEITKSQVRMPQGPLKSVGDHKITLALHSDVVVEITVSVLSDAV